MRGLARVLRSGEVCKGLAWTWDTCMLCADE